MADPTHLRDLDPSGDRPALEWLWAAVIGDVWPMLPAGLGFLRTGVVAEAGGEPVGVVAVAAGDDRQGGMQLLLVDPSPGSGRGSGPSCSKRGSSGCRRSGSRPSPSAAGATTTCGRGCRRTCRVRPGSSPPGAGGSGTA